MGYELSKTYQLRTSDFDRYSRIKPSSVLDIFQEVAGCQADDMGIGGNLMNSEGVFWAVVRMKYELVKSPAVHGEVVARTWPHTPSRFAFQRDYSMRDSDGELLVKASSEWVLMDIEARSLASVKDHCRMEDDYCDDRSFGERIRKVRPFDVEEADGEPFVVVPHASDVDLNGHVNNARYATYVMDALDLGENEVVTMMQMDYKHEVLENQELRIFIKRDGEAVFTQGINNAGDVSFVCEMHIAG